jgi:hypothetical protein
LIDLKAPRTIAGKARRMTNSDMQVVPFRRRRHPVDLALCVAAGATVMGLAFLSCWLLAVVHWPWAPRGLVDFFAPNPIETVDALLVGGDYALVSGALLGGAIGGVYNLFERLLRGKPAAGPAQPEA